MAFQVTGSGHLCAATVSVENADELWKEAGRGLGAGEDIAENQSLIGSMTKEKKLVEGQATRWKTLVVVGDGADCWGWGFRMFHVEHLGARFGESLFHVEHL